MGVIWVLCRCLCVMCGCRVGVVGVSWGCHLCDVWALCCGCHLTLLHMLSILWGASYQDQVFLFAGNPGT